MKRIAIILSSIIFTLLILAVAAVLVGPSFVDWNVYKKQAQEQIKKTTGHDVAFNGNVSIGIFPSPYVSLKDVVVAQPAGFSEGSLASFKALDVHVAMAPLFSGKVEVTGVNLDEPVINLEVKKDGSQNWMTSELKAISEGKDSGAQQQAAEGGNSEKPQISLQGVEIEDGALYYKAAGAEPVAIKDINVAIDADSLQGPFALDGKFKAYDQDIEIKGKVKEFKSSDEPMSVVAEGSAQPMGVKFSYAGVVEPAKQAVQGKADVSFKDGDFKGFITANKEKIDVKDMEAHVQGHSIKGAVSSTLNPVKFSGKVNVDGTNAAISGAYDQVLTIAMNADNVNFDEIIKELPKAKSAAGAGVVAGEEKNAAKAPAKNSGMMDVNFDVNIANAVYKTEAVKGLKVFGTLRKNTLTLQNFSIDEVAGASAQAKGKVGNIQDLSGLDLKIAADVKDIQKFAAFAQLDPAGLPKQVDAFAADIALAGNMEALNTTATIKALNGSVTAQGVVKNPQTKPSMDDMAVEIKHPNFNEAMRIFASTAPQYASWSKPLNFKANVALKDKVTSISNIQASVAGTSMDGTMSIDSSAAKPMISGNLKFGDLVMRSVGAAPAGGSAQGSGGASSSGGGKWSSAAMDSSWLNAMNADLDIQAASLVYESWETAQPSIKFVMKDGVLNIQNLKAGLYGGTLQMASTMKAANGNQGLNVQAKTQFDNVDLEKLAGSFIGTKLIQASGHTDMAMEVSGSGLSQRDIVSSLSGNGTLNGKDIVMEGFDLKRFARAMSLDSKPGDTAMGLWKTSTKGGQTAFETLDGQFSVNSGVVSIAKLDLTGQEANLTTKGNVNLPQWTIATEHTITLSESEGVPPFTVKISGPLDNPANTFGQGVLENYLQQKLSRKLDKVISDKLGIEQGGAPIEQKLLNKFLGDKLGIPQPANGNTAAPQPAQQPAQQQAQPQQQTQQEIAPASGDNWDAPAQQQNAEPAPAQQEQPNEITPEDAMKGLLEGLIKKN